MRRFTFVLLIVVVMSISAFAQGRSGVEGAWRLSEIVMTGKYAMTMKITQPSMYLFTRTHFSKIYIGTDKPRPEMDNYSKANAEQLYSIFVDGFDASAGTYEIAGGKLTLHTSVAKSPTDMKEGSWTTYSMNVTANTITLTPETSNLGPVKKQVTFKLTRVE